jgi:endonuclease I
MTLKQLAGCVGSVAMIVVGASMVAAAPATGYYDTVDLTSASALRDTVHDIIKDHTRYPYTSSATDTWDILDDADEDPNNSSNILDLYKNASYTKAGGGNSYYNREHSWPKSYGFPIDGAGNYPYTDCHHLFACDSGYNSSRNNRYYDDCASGCTEKPTDTNNGQGGTGQSNWRATNSWETWIGKRGDVARALLYMDVRYEGGTNSSGYSEPDLILTDNTSLIVSNTSSNQSVAYMGLLSTLLAWSAQDPPDDLERLRNDIVESYQGNRNPFVDYPEWIPVVFEGDTLAPWINEFHYDNSGADTGEFVEVMGLEGMDLTDWQIVGYNGADGGVYKTVTLSGSLPSSSTECFTAGYVTFTGMQNGPDGLALVDPNGVVYQFISYEGSFTATDGDADGMTSIDIGVSESGSTPVGDSIQLTGTAAGYSQFVWNGPDDDSPGDVNDSQTLEGACGTGGGGGGSTRDPWINEFHYDNSGSDTGEFVEIAGPAGLDLTGWKVYGYNGSGGGTYSSVTFSGSISDLGHGTGVMSHGFTGMQNGAPDGLALVDDSGNVVQFISYEGSFTASGGPADGLTSTNIGVSETSSTSAGYSLQLSGTGCEYGDFTWQSPAAATAGTANNSQTFSSGCD